MTGASYHSQCVHGWVVIVTPLGVLDSFLRRNIGSKRAAGPPANAYGGWSIVVTPLGIAGYRFLSAIVGKPCNVAILIVMKETVCQA